VWEGVKSMGKKQLYEYSDGIEDGIKVVYRKNLETGDITKIPTSPRKNTSSNFRKGEFSTVHNSLKRMLKSKKNYSNLTFRLLFELWDRIEFNNRIRTFRQAELADILESHQQHISTSLKVLEKDEIIKKSGHDYYFTPKFIRHANDGIFDGEEA
jgi:hypothetical protein